MPVPVPMTLPGDRGQGGPWSSGPSRGAAAAAAGQQPSQAQNPPLPPADAAPPGGAGVAGYPYAPPPYPYYAPLPAAPTGQHAGPPRPPHGQGYPLPPNGPGADAPPAANGYGQYPAYAPPPGQQHPPEPSSDDRLLAAGSLSSLKKRRRPLEEAVAAGGGTGGVGTDPNASSSSPQLRRRKLDHAFAAQPAAAARNATPIAPAKLGTGAEALHPTPLLSQSPSSAEKRKENRPYGNEEVPPPPGGGTSSPPQNMSALDVLVCQNMEVFQATEADASAYDAAEAGRVLGDPSLVAPALEAGQVGFRCVHTAGKLGPQQAIPPPAAVVYPASVSAVSSALSAVGREHFARCPSLPQEVRAAFGEARAAEQEEARKGRAGGKDEWRRIGFLDFCADFCGKVGVRNRDPLRSGLAYWGGGVGHAAATSAGLAAAEAVLAMAATPLTSRRDRPQVQPGPGLSAAKYLPPTPGAPVPPGFAFFYDGYSAWICRCKYAHTHTQMGWMRMTCNGRKLFLVLNPWKRMHSSPAYSIHRLYSFFFSPQTDCCSIPYAYRGEGSVWNGQHNAPPPQSAVDHHLKACRGGYGPPPPHPGLATPGNEKTMQQQHAAAAPSPSQSRPSYYPYGPPPPPYNGGYPGHIAAPGRPPQLSYTPSSNGNYQYHNDEPTSSAVQGQARQQRSPEKTDPEGVDGSGSDDSVQSAIDFLVDFGKNFVPRLEPSYIGPEIELIVGEDRLLLTDYFFHMIQQLRLCRFSEKDRKTRGGKREGIALGYGGLECIHCTGTANGRKFFWSNVDRLANSFAEIPAHVLKCRRCPQEIKTSLLELKLRHSGQMSKLPRGSQKVFFRRMWRRIHDDDPKPRGSDPAPVAKDATKEMPDLASKDDTREPVLVRYADAPKELPPPPGRNARPTTAEESVSQTLVSLEGVVRTPIAPRLIKPSETSKGGMSSPIMGPRERIKGFADSGMTVSGTTEGAARALAASAQAAVNGSKESSHPIVMLAVKEDQEWLSDNDCFVRRNLEIFAATERDIALADVDRKIPIKVGQIGCRCVHCAVADQNSVMPHEQGISMRGTAVSFPYSISGIYEAVREFQRLHLESCPHLPDEVREKLKTLKGSSSLSSVLRRYYVMAAKALGMCDTPEGIRAGGAVVALGPNAFTGSSNSIVPASSTSTPLSDRTPFNENQPSSQFAPNSTPRGGTPYGYGPALYPPPYGHFYGPPGGVQASSFLTSAITPLESRKRKGAPPPRATPQSDTKAGAGGANETKA